MQEIPDKSIDLILCDLPYGTTWAKWDNCIDLKELWEQYNRICTGAVVLFATQPFASKLVMSNLKNYKYSWYFSKNILGNYLNAKRQPLRCIEEICVFNKHKYNPQDIVSCDKKAKRGTAAKTTMQNYKNQWCQTKTNYPKNLLVYSLDKEKFHPTQKPVALLEYLIKTYTNPGDVVLDNCMGSGSTCVAAINTGRHYIGYEKEQKYFDIALDRIRATKEVEP